MKNQLTKENVDHLFTFVKSKYVHWEDVQYEIVDHLASSIEDVQEENPNIGFEEGLRKVYSKFPITGFTNLVAAKEKAVYRYWLRRVGIYMLQFFELPRVIFTLFLGLSIFSFLTLMPEKGPEILHILVSIILVFFFFVKRKTARFMKENNQFLVVRSLFDITQTSVVLAFVFPVNMMMGDYSIGSNIHAAQIAILFTLLLLFDYASTYHFPEMLREEVEEKYSHLKINLAN